MNNFTANITNLLPGNMVKVAGLDCAMRNLGIAEAYIDVTTMKLQVHRIDLVTTEKSQEKQIRRSSDDLSRAMILAQSLADVQGRVDFFMAEIPTGSQSSRASYGFGMAVGCIGSLTKPIIQVSPTDVKKIVTGRKTASKDEIMKWASDLYPHLPWVRLTHNIKTKKKGDLTDANEHIADAIGVLHAGIQMPEFKQAVALHQAMARLHSVPQNAA